MRANCAKISRFLCIYIFHWIFTILNIIHPSSSQVVKKPYRPYYVGMALFSKKLGIDLGTSNTLVFLPGRGIVLNEPSVVAVSEQDNQILAVGIEAKDMIGKTPDNIIAYRPMRDGVIADYRVTEAMLRYFINKALGRWNIWKPDVMVSVPAGVTSTERRAVVEAAIKAGAKNAYVVKEPILAAIGAGISIQEPNGHMLSLIHI